MSRPLMESIKHYTDTVSTFAGIDRRPRAGEGRFTDMENISAAKYPIMATRAKRYMVSLPGSNIPDGKITGMVAKEKMCYVKGSSIYVGNEWVDMGLNADVDHQLISFGSYIIILPEKKYINYADKSDRGDIEAMLIATTNFGVALSDIDGNKFENVRSGTTAPTDPGNGDYWLDTSGVKHVLKQYSEYSQSWVGVVSSYIRLSQTGIGDNFKDGDAITISGIPAQSPYSFLNGSHVISHVEESSSIEGSVVRQAIIIPGIPEATGDYIASTENPVLFKRTMPDMDFVIESGNRLWGCRYGEVDGKRVNEIYASKLGDFKNWNVFEGTSMDSYAATVGTDGKFTGAVTYRGNPHFFKENVVHVVSGMMPSAYQIYTNDIDGVAERCGSSLSVVDNVLFYKSRTGVCVYDGSFPANIGGALGKNVCTGAVAGDCDGKYYIWMNGDAEGLYCYDTVNGIWTRESSKEITHFESYHGILYCTDGESVFTVNGYYEHDSVTPEGDFDWYAVTNDIGIGTDNKKYLSRLSVRMRLSPGATMRIRVSYDSEDSFETVYEAEGTSMRLYNAFVRTRRCDHLRMRFEGRGECEIFSITKYTQYGSVR